MTALRNCFIAPGGWVADRDIIQRVNEQPLNKGLFGRLFATRPRLCYFRFDSPARVCFLSVFPSPRDLKFRGAPRARRRNVKAKSGTGIIELLVPSRGISNARSVQLEPQM